MVECKGCGGEIVYGVGVSPTRKKEVPLCIHCYLLEFDEDFYFDVKGSKMSQGDLFNRWAMREVEEELSASH